MSGVTGLDLAGCAAALKSSGGLCWDADRDCIPRYTLDALRIIEGVVVGWDVCPECREAQRGERDCDVCGRPIDRKPGTVYGPEG